MKTKLTERALYMSHIGDLYVQWLLEQEKLLKESYLMTIFESKEVVHPKLVPSLTANLGKN